MDQCKLCSCYGKPEECEKQECTYHELWYVKMLKQELGYYVKKVEQDIESSYGRVKDLKEKLNAN